MTRYIYRTYHFIRYIHMYLKFFITNYRFKKYGYRKFRFSLYIAEKDKDGNIIKFNLVKNDVDVTANYLDRDKMMSIPIPDKILKKGLSHEQYRMEQLPFILLRDEHHDLFKACDHLTYKEII